jgi:hypothetical protein
VNLNNVPVRVIDMTKRQTMVSDGSTGWVERFRTTVEISNVGPYLAGITIHGNMQNRTSNFEYKVIGQYSYDNEVYTTFSSDVLSAQNTNGNVISAKYTTHTDFGLYIRLVVQVRNGAGTNVESGEVSTSAALQFIS